MTTLRYEQGGSRLTIETRAKGMLAKLAHDLSIEVREPNVTASIEGGRITVVARVRVASLSVVGVRKGGAVDRGVLSASDRADIERKIQGEVFRGPEVVVTMEAPLADGALGEGRRTVDATGRVEAAGKSARVSSRATIEVASGRAKAQGRVKLDLPSLSITPPKGPLGAFRVDDEVEIDFDLAFVIEG